MLLMDEFFPLPASVFHFPLLYNEGAAWKEGDLCIPDTQT